MDSRIRFLIMEGAKLLAPNIGGPIKLVYRSAQLGLKTGADLGTESARLRSEGIYNPSTDLASKEILRYEHSALGSSRII